MNSLQRLKTALDNIGKDDGKGKLLSSLIGVEGTPPADPDKDINKKDIVFTVHVYEKGALFLGRNNNNLFWHDAKKDEGVNYHELIRIAKHWGLQYGYLHCYARYS